MNLTRRSIINSVRIKIIPVKKLFDRLLSRWMALSYNGEINNILYAPGNIRATVRKMCRTK